MPSSHERVGDLRKVHDPEPLWVARERRRAELLANLHAAEASLARGWSAIATASLRSRKRDADGASPRAITPPRSYGEGLWVGRVPLPPAFELSPVCPVLIDRARREVGEGPHQPLPRKRR